MKRGLIADALAGRVHERNRAFLREANRRGRGHDDAAERELERVQAHRPPPAPTLPPRVRIVDTPAQIAEQERILAGLQREREALAPIRPREVVTDAELAETIELAFMTRWGKVPVTADGALQNIRRRGGR